MNQLIAAFLAVLLMFYTPILYFAQKQDAITQSYVSQETTKLVNAIKNNGYLTDSMYDAYLDKLDNTGNLYQVKIVHEHEIVAPIYDEAGDFQNDVSIHYTNVYEEDILKEIYEKSGMYTFDQEDYITVKVNNRTKTYASKLQQLLFQRDIPGDQIFFTYGGMIRDENY